MKKPAKKIAVVGAGYWGKNLVRNFASLGSLSVLCDLDEKNLNESKKTYPGLKTTTSLPDILSDDSIDAVVISTPAEMHY
ncbi:MAG: Gfo/Idh/MocA family oxidoreductase, partial [Proteobacteria bacterium]|nr:Gfo/Idh/MocA family oxidoreductase [Pseudomonadota bacterium]